MISGLAGSFSSATDFEFRRAKCSNQVGPGSGSLGLAPPSTIGVRRLDWEAATDGKIRHQTDFVQSTVVKPACRCHRQQTDFRLRSAVRKRCLDRDGGNERQRTARSDTKRNLSTRPSSNRNAVPPSTNGFSTVAVGRFCKPPAKLGRFAKPSYALTASGNSIRTLATATNGNRRQWPARSDTKRSLNRTNPDRIALVCHIGSPST